MLAASDYADKDYAEGMLDDARRAMKGAVAAQLRAKGESISIISDLVRKDLKYLESAKAWRDARMLAIMAKFKYEQVCRYQDNLRTQQVSDRQVNK